MVPNHANQLNLTSSQNKSGYHNKDDNVLINNNNRVNII